MSFCRICTGRRKPGPTVKIVVNLKKDTICRECERAYHIKLHKKRRDKKLIIVIRRIYVDVGDRSRRPNRAPWLFVPVCRDAQAGEKEDRWLDTTLPWGEFVDLLGFAPWSDKHLDVGNFVPWN